MQHIFTGMSSFMHACLLLIAVTVLPSCKKEEQNITLEKAGISKTVVKWLDNNKASSQPNKASSIDLLKNSLDFSKVTMEAFMDGDHLVIIPIKSNFQKESVSKDAILNLVLIKDSRNTIKNGRILLFTPNSKEITSAIPKNTLPKILRLEKASCNGNFTFMSITGTLLHKYEYKNGNIFSFGELRNQSLSDNQKNSTLSTNSNCIDWYLVTTYYIDGIPVHQESQYIGTTCEGCDDPNFQSICPDDGGSGGGGGVTNQIIETTNVSIETEEIDETDVAVGTSPRINFRHNAQIERIDGYVTSVSIYPTTIANAYEVYTDSHGRNVTRILSTYGHNNSWVSSGATATLYWSCFVYGRWIYTNGTPEYNRAWSHSRTAVR